MIGSLDHVLVSSVHVTSVEFSTSINRDLALLPV